MKVDDNKLYYLITPKENLLTKLNDYFMKWGENAVQDLREPSLWSTLDMRALSEKIQRKQVIVVFLADLYDDFSDNLDENYRKLRSELLGNSPIQFSVFDEWWEIHPIPYINDLEGYIDDIHTDILKNFVQNGDPDMEYWISHIIEQREDSY